MGKRKRVQAGNYTLSMENDQAATPVSLTADESTVINGKRARLQFKGDILNPTIQIITGSYEKILHGVTASLSWQAGSQLKADPEVKFADTFLFNAHGSAIRCLAISPPSSSTAVSSSQKAILASGSSDQIINLYHISTSVPPPRKGGATPTPSLLAKKTNENPRNRELGSLQHHSSSINAIYFPTRSKLLSAAEDSTIAITRTRDWTVLSTIKAPIPKAHGRPSGDTAPYGGAPSGINDFAVHPSMKVLVSVGKGEKCMRLWNLVTGKKAGVLNFARDLLHEIGEGRRGSGEGRKVEWNSLGEEFVVAFEKGAMVFGMDSKPKCRIFPSPPTKLHQLRYTELLAENGLISEYLTVSTEDGRILFFITDTEVENTVSESRTNPKLATLQPIGQVGGIADGLDSRVKDYEILRLTTPGKSNESLLIVTGSSDGAIRLWIVDEIPLLIKQISSNGAIDSDATQAQTDVPQIGKLLGVYETGNRITCLKAYIMSDPAENKTCTSSDDAMDNL